MAEIIAHQFDMTSRKENGTLPLHLQRIYLEESDGKWVIWLPGSDELLYLWMDPEDLAELRNAIDSAALE